MIVIVVFLLVEFIQLIQVYFYYPCNNNGDLSYFLKALIHGHGFDMCVEVEERRHLQFGFLVFEASLLEMFSVHRNLALQEISSIFLQMNFLLLHRPQHSECIYSKKCK
jgi:hypothetical protein